MSCRLGVAALVAMGLAAPAAHAQRPRSVIIDQGGPVEIGTGAIPYNKIYLNRCAGGCVITPGQSNSLTDKWNINGTRTLTKFPFDDATWTKVVDCVKDTFSPFNVEITETDPAPGNHFEIMIAGRPTDLGMSSAIGGVAPGGVGCNSYMNNALVFDFAAVWSGGLATCGNRCIEEICSTAAQEVAHAWSLDHVTDASDPMTYSPFSGRRYFANVANKCGSDCSNGMQYGLQCSGAGNQERQCYPCTSTRTQNSFQLITSFFGAGAGTPPIVKIDSPKNGANVMAGFGVTTTPTDDSGVITKVQLAIDGTMVGELTTGGPTYQLAAPGTLGNGTHHVEVTAFDRHGVSGKGSIYVYIGPPCQESSDCERDADVCIAGNCVPGPGVDGGLGTTCATDDDCLSGHCASDGTNDFCVEDCTVGQCPGDFGCLDDGTGDGTGLCWPGYDDGSGGCGCDSNRPGGPVTMGLMFGVLVFTWRRRRR